MKQTVVGIRAGEKMHEVMCPAETCRNTLEFDDHYAIMPSHNFFDDHTSVTNGLGETGKPVQDGFEYSSETNDHFLSVDELKVYA